GGIRMHGNDSQRVGGKPSFRLYFRDEYGPNNLEQLFIPESDYQKFDALVIRGGHQDNRNPFIQDELSRRLFKDMGQASSVGTFTHVMLNGHYFGYYNPVERYNVAFFQQKYDSDSDWDVLRNRTLGEGSAEPFDQLFAFVKNNDLSDSNNYREASNRLDLVNFCDYLLLNVYGSTWDWPGNNVTISHEAKPGGKVRYHVWDAEGSFGQRAEVTGDTTQIELLDGSSEESNLFLGLIKNPSFTRLFASRFREHFYEDGPLTDSHIVERFLGLRKEVLGAIPNFVPVVSFAWTPSRRHYMIAHLYQHGLIQEVSKPVTGLPPFSHTPPIEPNDSPLASDADRNGRVDSRDLDRFVEDFRVRNNKEVFGSYVRDASGWRVWCLPVGEGVRDIAFADLDRDERPDLLSVNGNYGYLQIQKNLGGTFSKPEFVWSGLGALAIATADLNGDGLTDVVTGNDGMTSQTLTVLLNRGNGMLERIREIEVLPIEENEFLHIRQLQLADFDGDSNLDIFVAFHSAFLGQDNAVAILFGDGAGDFKDRAYSPMGGTQLLGSSMAVVENWGQASSPPLGILLDGGKSANRFSVSGSRQIEQLQPIPNPGSFEQVALSSADMDLDGNADLVFGGGPIGTLHIMYGSEDGAFSSTQTIQIQATRPETIHIADFNSDERPDILVSNLNPTLVPASTVQIFWNLGGRTFDKGEPMNLGGEINFPDWLESSDIDNDGDIDFAVSDEINGRITLFYNESAERKNYSDFNRDGRIDFLDLGVAASEWRKETDSSGISN
ncbi:MAG: VCBS repeat-containing protein, partial [Candidatus Omnitrophica bacterium]|nr:VCBS repeat-containing protein [Candidatus Omnitrophota bacterium]